MRYDTVIVGAGAAGLTAAAYLAKSGISTLVCEKQPTCGGLVNSFERDGFVFDGGIRALEDAGVLFRMLKQLGIEMEFVKNRVSLGIEDRVIEVESDDDLEKYEDLLIHFFPESREEIHTIVTDMRSIMQYMDIQYGIDNPLFLDPKEDREYFLKEVIPWMFKYVVNVSKIMAKNRPVVEYLRNFTTNQALLDIITQHFFTETPAFFALSYIKLYQDYHYPKSGTGEFIHQLVDLIKKNNGEIRTGTEINSIDIGNKSVTTARGEEIPYRQLLWAADQKRLYECIDMHSVSDKKVQGAVNERRALLASKIGNNSVLTLYASVDLDKSYFENISNAHFFYTPSRTGQTAAGEQPVNGSWKDIRTWLDNFYALTTYEISIPALRNSALVPSGKTGLIISMLFDYRLAKYINDNGWDKKFRDHARQVMIRILDESIYPGLAGTIIDSFISTPLTIQRAASTTDGAITGWSYTNYPMPAENRLARIARSISTPLPDVYQAGQWTFSPSGFPVSLITGKLAGDKISKRLK